MSALERFEYEEADNCTVLRFVDSQLFETSLLMQLEAELNGIIEKIADGRLIIDFTGVDFCSTSLINILLRAAKLVQGAQGTLRLSGMRSTVRDSFRMLNLEGTVFSIYDTLDEAESV